MVCPSCGAQSEAQDKFCAICGTSLPEATPPLPPPAPAAPPPWSQTAPPPWSQAAPPPWSQTAPPPPPPPAQYGANPIAGGRALVGGLVAIGSAWLPWIIDSSGRLNLRPIDATDLSDLACGYYLLVGGGIAVACGLLLLLRVGRGTSLPLLLGIGAIAGSVLVLAVEVVAYGMINDTINPQSGLGADTGSSIGYGLWVGIGAGVLGALGGLLGLFNRR